MRYMNFVIVAVLLLAAGCTSPLFEGTIFEAQPMRDPEIAKVAINTQQMSIEFQQLAEQMNVLNRNQELLENRITQLEIQGGGLTQTQSEINSLRREITQLKTERGNLQKEITDDLAGRIEKIAARQQAEINAARRGVAQATAQAAGSGYEHKVEAGQTLSEIARGYGKSVDAIMKANKITNPSLIRVGQTLFIPD